MEQGSTSEYIPEDPIIGTETEHTVNSPDGVIPNLRKSIHDAGYYALYSNESHRPYMLDNGSKVYQDGLVPEYATPECRGARWAAAATRAGLWVMRNIASVSELDTSQHPIYRRSGYAHGRFADGKEYTENNTTTGYHTNHAIRKCPSGSETLDGHLQTFVATEPVLAGAGLVGEEYMLSQKGPYLGNKRLWRTKEEAKEGCMPGAARVEILCGDPKFSLDAMYIELGTQSAVITYLAEARRMRNAQSLANLPRLSYARGVFEGGTPLQQLHTPLVLQNRKTATRCEIQEAYLLAARGFHQSYGASAEVLEPVDAGLEALDVLRQAKSIDDLEPLKNTLEWVARLYKLREVCGDRPITRSYRRAVMCDLLWDRVLPAGFGMRYWQEQGSTYVPQWMVEHCVREAPPGTRAEERARLIRENPWAVYGAPSSSLSREIANWVTVGHTSLGGPHGQYPTATFYKPVVTPPDLSGTLGDMWPRIIS